VSMIEVRADYKELWKQTLQEFDVVVATIHGAMTTSVRDDLTDLAADFIDEAAKKIAPLFYSIVAFYPVGWFYRLIGDTRQGQPHFITRNNPTF
jgi:hypothetical protein